MRAGDIAPFVDFFSFGTNDLTQTTFGISRDDAPVFLNAYLRRGLYDADPRRSDAASRIAEVRDLDAGVTTTEPFDQLLIATGAAPIRPPFPNLDARGVHGIQTIPDAVALDVFPRSATKTAGRNVAYPGPRYQFGGSL